MRNLIVGLFIGISLTYSISAIAGDDLVLTKSGRMKNVEVIDDQGKRVCDDPWYHADLKAVKCE